MADGDGTASVGIVGLGTRGTAHAEHVEGLGHEVVGGVDVDSDVRRGFEESFDAPAFESHESLLDRELDALEVVTPNAYHEAPAVEAFERDLHVFVEKPLAHTLESAERIADAARGSGGVGMVGFNDRFRDVVALLESRIRSGDLGAVRHVEAAKVRRRGMPDRGSWFTRRELAGGGALVDLGGHALSAALAFLGFPEELEVFGTTRSTFGDREDYADPDGWQSDRDSAEGPFDVEDSATALLRTPDGASVSLDLAWATNRETRREFVVRGTEGGARVSGDALELLGTGTEVTDHYCDAAIEAETDVWRAVEAGFLEAVVAGTPPDRNTVGEALAIQRVVDGIYRSDRLAESVTVRTDAP